MLFFIAQNNDSTFALEITIKETKKKKEIENTAELKGKRQATGARLRPESSLKILINLTG